MKALAGVVVAATMVLVAGTAVAGPCDQAERGTYLSNVCWLIEEFSHDTAFAPTVVSVNEEECSVTVDQDYLGFADDIVYFNRGNPKSLDIKITDGRFVCWHLRGEGVTGEGFRSNVASVCGHMIEFERIRNAFTNLYTKYCEGVGSEF